MKNYRLSMALMPFFVLLGCSSSSPKKAGPQKIDFDKQLIEGRRGNSLFFPKKGWCDINFEQRICVFKNGDLKKVASDEKIYKKPRISVVDYDKINWGNLNPARGEKSPKAFDLWGDRTKKGHTGFLVKFIEGFSSPPHIHNVTYRGIVIKGLVHNDDPKAKNLWMPMGSYWEQPKGDIHITSAKGEENVAFIEIFKGPYLVRPSSKAFQTKEKPLNTPFKKLKWSPISQSKFVELWQNPFIGYGHLFSVSKKPLTKIHSRNTEQKIVVISGKLQLTKSGVVSGKTINAGSLLLVQPHTELYFKNESSTDALVYVQGKDKISLINE